MPRQGTGFPHQEDIKIVDFAASSDQIGLLRHPLRAMLGP
jgi:hypothetical protein